MQQQADELLQQHHANDGDVEDPHREELHELRGELRDKLGIMAEQLKVVSEKMEFTQNTLIQLLRLSFL